MAGNIEVAKAFVTIVPTLEGAQQTITQDLTGVTNEASEKAGKDGGEKFASKFGSAVKSAGVAIGGAITAATAAAVGTGKAFVSATKETATYGDVVDKTSQKLGISRDAFQSYDYVLNLAGTDMASMTTGMKTLTNRLDEAKNGSEDAQAMFASLGFSMDDLATMSREDLFEKTITGFQGMEDSAERAALANDLFGKSGQNLNPVFNMTAEETEELIKQAHDYGMVMSDEAVSASADYVDAMTTLDKTMTGLKNNMMTQFLPGMTSIMDGLAAVFAGDEGGIAQVQEGLTSLIGNLVMFAPQFFQLAQTLVMSILQGFAPLLPSLVNAIFNFINTGIKTVVSMIPSLTPVIIEGIKGVCQAIFEGLPLILDGLITMITEIVTWLTEDDNITTFIDGIIQLVSLLVLKFSELLPILLPAIVEIISQIAISLTKPENVNLIINSVLILIGSVVVAIANALPQILKLVVETTKNILNQLKSWGTTIISNLSSWFSKVLPKIQTFVTNVLSKIKELPQKVIAIGKNLVEGLWNGISNKIEWVKQKIKGMGSQITSAIKGVFGIKSPSRVWRDEIGNNLALGIGEGFTSTMSDVEGDMVNSMDGLTGSMTAEVNAYGSGGASTLGTSTYNGGNISINVYGAEGQNTDDLAKQVAYRLEEMTRRKEAVYG